MFGRLLRISIRNAQGNSLILVDPEQGNKSLVADVDIKCVPNKERTSATIKINNLDKYTRNIIKTNNYKYITVEFGYKDVNGGLLSSIFEGTLQRMIIQRPSPETSLTVMYAYELGDVYNYGYYSGVFSAGTTIYDVAQTIANEGEVVIPIVLSEQLKSYVLKEDKSMYGSQLELLQQLGENLKGMLFMHTMGKVYIVTTRENDKSEVIVMSGVDSQGRLRSASGLIGLPSLEDDGISFECLVNPQMRIYSTVLIANDLISDAQEGFERKSEAGAEYDENGLYVVVKLDTHLTNGPSESKMRARALSRDYYLRGNEQ